VPNISSPSTKSTIVNRQSSILLGLLFPALLLTHLPLLRLPYFWDEAGYYIPAARDLLLAGSLIPHSTLTNAHPPLVMAWLAAAWKLFGYSPLTTRVAMLLIAVFTLLGVYRLARQVAGAPVAAASVLCTALYPVFFAQSSLAHLDLAAACLILWGIVFYLDDRRFPAILLFALACLAKETAALVPLALFAWELILHAVGNRRLSIVNSSITRSPDHPIARSFSLLFSLLPIIAWFGFHYARTGQVFGSPEFFRYNVAATLNPLRFAAALLLRLWHLLGYMNMFLLTLLAAFAMFLRAPSDQQREEWPKPIAPSTQAIFYVLIIAHVVAFSIVGGAALARYLLPVYPLVIIVCVSTLRRRMPWWPAFIAVVCAGFVAALVVNPPYRFAPEDNLAYSDYVRLHQSADAFVAQRFPQGRVLTAWPASDELMYPWLGYVPRTVPIVRIEDFSALQILSAADARSHYRAALVFSTKYEPRLRLRVPGWERLQERFFGYHRDLPPELIARMLGARVVFQQHGGGQWVAVLQMETTENVRLERY
jgi:4-amino-4-deoxy-L-arabinose transferase-like glycosyltransferase